MNSEDERNKAITGKYDKRKAFKKHDRSADRSLTSTLPALPIEVWANVASQVVRSDLFRLRFVSKAFAEITAPHLFRELVVTWTSNCLRNILEIAHRKVFARYVTILHIEVDLLDYEYASYEYWKGKATDKVQFCSYLAHQKPEVLRTWGRGSIQAKTSIFDEWKGLPGITRTSHDLTINRKLFKSLLDDQKVLFKDNLQLSMLVAALSKFERVTNVRTFSSYHLQKDCRLFVDRHAEGSYHDTIKKLYRMNINHNETLDCPQRQRLQSLQTASLINEPFSSHGKSASFDPISTIFAALFMARVEPQTLGPIFLNSNFWYNQKEQLYWRQQAGRMGQSLHPFHDIACDLDPNYDPQQLPNDFNPVKELALLLQPARHLTNLSLAFRPISQSDEGGLPSRLDLPESFWRSQRLCDITKIFKRLRFPALKRLQLECCSASAKEFAYWIEKHAWSLRRVIFKEMYLKRGNHHDAWKRTIKLFKCWNRFTSVELDGILDKSIVTRLESQQSLYRGAKDGERGDQHVVYCDRVARWLMSKRQPPRRYPSYHLLAVEDDPTETDSTGTDSTDSG